MGLIIGKRKRKIKGGLGKLEWKEEEMKKTGK